MGRKKVNSQEHFGGPCHLLSPANKPMPLNPLVKRHIKRSLEYIAAHFGPHRWPSKEPKLWVLMYHRVLPADAPEMQDAEPGMVVTPETLDLHLKLLSQWAEPVFLEDWLARSAAGESLPKRAVAITFDDGWVDNYQHAFPVLKAHNFPTSIFLVSDWIGTPQMFWPERLARILRIASQLPKDDAWLNTVLGADFQHGKAPSRKQLAFIFARCKQWDDLAIHTKLDDLSNRLQLPPPETTTLLNWEQVHEMQASGIIRFGSHTRRHIRLNEELSAELAHTEICASQSLLEQKLSRPVSLFCYPNGDHSPAAVQEVREHYLGAVTTKRGINDLHTPPHQLFRVGVHNDVSSNAISFMAKLSCWL
ncbi:putative polysaccharide deacetylase [gamma proteobacterium HdN1]|nr:putative polysaccharide deacetylase [gamma proteobacterium HdN1]